MATEQGLMSVMRASRPTFRGPHDKVAYTIHAAFLAAGYSLTATGTSAFSDQALSSPSTDEVGIEGWNEFQDNYAFVYSNLDKGCKKILVKCLAMNHSLLVDALKNGHSQPLHLEINVNDYAVDNGGSSGNYSAQFKDLAKLVSSINTEILGKLSGSSPSDIKSSSAARGSTADTYQPAEPEHQPYSPSRIFVPPIYPGIGGSDAFPGPGAGMYPPRGDFGSGGGSIVGPDHPLFTGRIGGQQPGFPGALPSGAPPGARFDPYGPPGVPGFEPNRFVRNPRRSGGGVHPDLEQFGGDDYI